MFRGINLCGAEDNTKFPEQHRTHLLLQKVIFSIVELLLNVNQAARRIDSKPPVTTVFDYTVPGRFSQSTEQGGHTISLGGTKL